MCTFVYICQYIHTICLYKNEHSLCIHNIILLLLYTVVYTSVELVGRPDTFLATFLRMCVFWDGCVCPCVVVS